MQLIGFFMEFGMWFYSEFWATMVIVTLSSLGSLHGDDSVFKPLQPAIASSFAALAMTNLSFWRGYGNPLVAIAHYRLGYLSLRNCVLNLAGELLGSIVGLGLVKLVTDDEAFNAGGGVGMAQARDELKWQQVVLFQFLIASVILFGCAAAWDLRIRMHRNSVPLHMVCMMTAANIAGSYFLGGSPNLGVALAASIYQDNYKHLPPFIAGQMLAIIFIPWIWLNWLTIRYHVVMPKPPRRCEVESQVLFSPRGVRRKYL